MDYGELGILMRLMRPADVLELLLEGRLIDAAEAHRCGFLDRLVPPGGLDPAVEAWVSAMTLRSTRLRFVASSFTGASLVPSQS